MLVTTFSVQNTNESLPAIQSDEGEWFFSAQDTCIFAEVATSKNATTWIKNNVPSKWIVEIKIPGKEGRPSLYLKKPGFYYAVCQGKSLKAMTFRDWVFEDLLVKLDSQRLYVLQQNGESLAEYQQREAALVAENQRLLEEKNTILRHTDKLMVYSIKEFLTKGLPNTHFTTKDFKAINLILWDYPDVEYRDGNYRGYNIPDLMAACKQYFGEDKTIYRQLKIAFKPFLAGKES